MSALFDKQPACSRAQGRSEGYAALDDPFYLSRAGRCLISPTPRSSVGPRCRSGWFTRIAAGCPDPSDSFDAGTQRAKTRTAEWTLRSDSTRRNIPPRICCSVTAKSARQQPQQAGRSSARPLRFDCPRLALSRESRSSQSSESARTIYQTRPSSPPIGPTQEAMLGARALFGEN